MRRVILKLSGEALSGGTGVGINAKSVQHIASEIKQLYDTGNTQIGIVVGAGNIWRGRDASENGMERASADYMGMLGTILNSLALQNALEALGIDTRTMSSISIPSVAEPYIRRRAMHHLEKGYVVIFGAGTGNPFFSTDTTAALRAAEIEADVILLAKKVDAVYDSDPNVNPDAKKFSKLTHQDLLEMGLGVMDSTAAALCMDNHIPIHVFGLDKPENVIKAAYGEDIGTIIE